MSHAMEHGWTAEPGVRPGQPSAQSVAAVAALSTGLDPLTLLGCRLLTTGKIDLEGFGEDIEEQKHGVIPRVWGMCAVYSNVRQLTLDSDQWLSTNAPHRTSQLRRSTRLNSSHVKISYAVFCLKKKKR